MHVEIIKAIIGGASSVIVAMIERGRGNGHAAAGLSSTAAKPRIKKNRKALNLLLVSSTLIFYGLAIVASTVIGQLDGTSKTGLATDLTAMAIGGVVPLYFGYRLLGKFFTYKFPFRQTDTGELVSPTPESEHRGCLTALRAFCFSIAALGLLGSIAHRTSDGSLSGALAALLFFGVIPLYLGYRLTLVLKRARRDGSDRGSTAHP